MSNIYRGLTNTFGAYQNFYETGILKSQTPSQISWIGSIQACLLLIVGGFITGPIFDAGYPRGLVILGSATAVFGMMMTSICKEYWQVVLAQGVVTGIGMGVCIYQVLPLCLSISKPEGLLQLGLRHLEVALVSIQT